MSRSLVLGELSERSKRVFAITAAFLMVVLCFQVLSNNALAGDGIIDDASALPSNNATEPQAIYHDMPPGSVDSFDNASYITVSDSGLAIPFSYVTNETCGIVYWTPSGSYIVNATHPEILTYRGLNGAVLVKQAIFTVQASDTQLLISDAMILTSSDAVLQVGYQLVDPWQNVAIGNMAVTYDFSEGKTPKITAMVEGIVADIASWNIVWMVTPGDNALLNVPELGMSAIDLRSLAGRQISSPDLKATLRIGSNSLVADWSDAKEGSLKVVQSEEGKDLSYSLKISFGQKKELIDPSLVSTTTIGTATDVSCQRKVFWNDGFYWIFYNSGSAICYRNSPDGRVWSAQMTIPEGTTPMDGSNFDVAYRDGYIGIAWVDSFYNLYFKKGVITSNKITWSSRIMLDQNDMLYSAPCWYPVTTAIGYDYSFWVNNLRDVQAYDYSYWWHEHKVYRSVNGEGNFITTSNWMYLDPSLNDIYWCALLPYNNGNMALLQTNYTTPVTADNAKMGVRFYNGSSGGWTALNKYDIGMTVGTTPAFKGENFSAVASLNGTVHLVYKGTNGNIRYARFYPSGSAPYVTDITAGMNYPTICLDSNGILHLFFVIYESSVYKIYHRQKMQFGNSWSSSNDLIYSATSGIKVKGLTSSMNPVGVFSLAWTEVNGGSKNVKFASAPLPYGTGGAPSNPWDRTGLSPYGTYFQMNTDFISPGSGLMTLMQQDISIPGRGGMDLGVSRIYQQPKYFWTNGTSYDSRGFPNCNLGQYWSLDLPWMDNTYVGLSNGQRYITQWGNGGNANEFVNHDGAQFVLRNVNKGGQFYELITSAGLRYKFDSTYKLVRISDLKNYNPLGATDTIPYDCLNLSYSGNSLISITESGQGRSISFTYSSGLLSRITRPDGKYSSFAYTTYNSKSYLTSVTDPDSRVTSFTYDHSAAYCLGGVTFPTGGKTNLTFALDSTPSSDVGSWMVTKESLKTSTGALIRQTNFDYKIINGKVVYAKLTNYDQAGVVQGYNEYVFRSAMGSSGETVKDASGVQMQSKVTWYDINGRPARIDTYKGDSQAINTSEYMSYDEWGNIIYQRDALGHETYYSYANTTTQNSFQGGDVLTRTSTGKIFYDAFDDWNITDWPSQLSVGSMSLNSSADPSRAPSVMLNRTSSSAGTAYVTHNFATQSSSFYVQASYMGKNQVQSYIMVLATSGSARVQIISTGSVFRYYDGTNYQTFGNYAANTWYDVGFFIRYASNTYDIYLNGTLVKSAAPLLASGSLNAIRFQAGYSGSSVTSTWFDNVRVYSSLSITVSGVDSSYIMELYDSYGSLLNRSKTTSTTITLRMAALARYAPPAFIKIMRIGNSTFSTPMSDIWGGDSYSLSKGQYRAGVAKTTRAFGLSTSSINDDLKPTGSTEVYSTYYGQNDLVWMSNSSLALSGGKYHQSNYPTNWSHYHGFTGATSGMSVSPTDTLVQYVWLEAGKIPNEIGIEFYINSAWRMAFWGGDSSGHNQIAMPPSYTPTPANTIRCGDVPQITGQWLQLTVNASALGISSAGTVTGVLYCLYGGMARWDLTSKYSCGIVVNGLTSGMTVKMRLDSGTLLSKTATSTSVTFYPEVNMKCAFPISATFSVYNSGGKLIYLGPRVNEIYNRDQFTYSASPFYVNQIKDGIHSRPVGSFAYQDYANTTKMENYYCYDVEGNSIETKSNLASGWVYSRAGYDIYGNMLWACDPTGRMTSYQYSSTDKNTYPTSSMTGELIEMFDWDRSWVLSYAPSNRTWITSQYSSVQAYSTACSINLGFSGAQTPYSGNKTMSKDFKTNKVSKLSVRMYVTSYTHDTDGSNAMDSGIRMRIYDSSGVNYATYTYWLACWSGNTNNRTTADPNIKVMYGDTTHNAWLNRVLYPSNDWNIDWSRCDKVKLELFVNVVNANGDTFNAYYDDLVYGDAADISQNSENFEGTHNWIPYETPARAWLIEQNSTTQSCSPTHSEQLSFASSGGSGQDYGTGMMYKVFNANSIGAISLRMFVDQYNHNNVTGDTMDSGIRIRLYDITGTNYATYTYWLACWSGATNNKTTADPCIKVVYGKPTMSSWLNLNLKPSSDWRINWDQCKQVKIELYVSTSYAQGDTFRVYFDDLSFSSSGFAKTDYRYDLNNGRVLSVMDASMHVTSYQYDVLGRLIRTNNTDGSFSNCTIDDTNNKVISFDPLRQKSITYFDSIGRMTKMERYGALATNYSSVCQYYNWQDKPVRSVEYPKASVTLVTYDCLGRTLTVKNNDTSVRSISYNDKANMVTVTDELGHKIVSVYDDLGRLTATREYNSASAYNYTLMTYDAIGSLKTVRAANGNVTTMSYDSLGRLTSTAYPDSKSESTTYDAAGRALNATARNGTIAQSVYDASGAPIRMIGNSDTIRTYYDAQGKVIQKKNALGNISYHYDVRGNVIRLIERIDTNSYWFNFTYDVNGNLLTTNYPGSVTITNNYDSYARLSAVKCGNTKLIEYSYNRDDSIATKKFNNGNSTMTYTYNNRDWVSRILAKTSGGVGFVDLNYTYSTNGNVAAIKSGLAGVGNEYYTYDFLGRLTKAMANTTFLTISYVYDMMGNRVWKNDTANSHYYYGAYNKLSNDGTYTYVYYPNGEVFYKNTTNTALNRWNYVYNSFDQLIEVKMSTYSGGAWGAFVSVARYYYDANGARAKVIEGAVTTRSVYVGHNPLYDVSSGGMGNCSIYVGGRLEMRYVSSSISFAYVSDALGSTRYVLKNGIKDASNIVFSAITYKPFGGAVTTSGSNNYTYTGEKLDASSGLEYLGARYYDPSTGRFISMDPVLGRLSSPQTLNRFVYCVNNPLLFTDPSGLFPQIYGSYQKTQEMMQSADMSWLTWQTIAIVAIIAVATIASGGTATLPTMIAIGALSQGAIYCIESGSGFSWEGLALNLGLGALGGGAGWVIGKAISVALPRISSLFASRAVDELPSRLTPRMSSDISAMLSVHSRNAAREVDEIFANKLLSPTNYGTKVHMRFGEMLGDPEGHPEMQWINKYFDWTDQGLRGPDLIDIHDNYWFDITTHLDWSRGEKLAKYVNQGYGPGWGVFYK